VPVPPTLETLAAGQARIEALLQTLIRALGDEELEPASLTLEGEPAGGERDQNAPL
jgi:hypothetical protein